MSKLLITIEELELIYNKNDNNVICYQPDVISFFKEGHTNHLSFFYMVFQALPQFQIINMDSDGGVRNFQLCLKIENLLVYLLEIKGDYIYENFLGDTFYFFKEFEDINRFISHINFNIKLALHALDEVQIRKGLN